VSYENLILTWSLSPSRLIPLTIYITRLPVLVYSRVIGDQAVRGRFHLAIGASPVQEDWSAWLPPAKSNVFEHHTGHLEVAYNIFSVALDESLGLSRNGKVDQALQAVAVIPSLCARLALPLEALLHTLGQHARHFGTVPKSAPMNASNFRGPREQYSARMSELLSRVLFTERSQFLHKIDALADMVIRIRKHVAEAAFDLASGASLGDPADWQSLDDAHFDLNTCFRESAVLLKSFLLVLPESQIIPFQNSVANYLRESSAQSALLSHHRRMVPIEGE